MLVFALIRSFFAWIGHAFPRFLIVSFPFIMIVLALVHSIHPGLDEVGKSVIEIKYYQQVKSSPLKVLHRVILKVMTTVTV